jgi:glycosyltransferase involved in cell wall biosynthesis
MQFRRKAGYGKRNLLVLNYVMDEAHPALAHQVSVIEGLSEVFDTVTVITGNSKYESSMKNIRVISSQWVPGQNFRNVCKFLGVFIREIVRGNYVSVFSHMTVLQSCLSGPVLKVLRIRHYLWYAHAQDSFFLRVAHFWCTGIITSTINSCPIQSNKVYCIGQSIDERKFTSKSQIGFPLVRLIHVGRLDPSKGINLIIDSVARIRVSNPRITLMFLGSASSAKSQEYINEIKDSWELEIKRGWLEFHESIPRNNLPNFLKLYDGFVHAFQGSLDKSLIEATFSNLPVATINLEYQRDFGTWSSDSDSLESEIRALIARPAEELTLELVRRLEIAHQRHSFSKWIQQLSIILH